MSMGADRGLSFDRILFSTCYSLFSLRRDISSEGKRSVPSFEPVLQKPTLEVSYGARRWSPHPYPNWVAGLNGWTRAEGRWAEGKMGDVLIDKAAASVEIMTIIKVLEDGMILEEMSSK
ncbi:hypothetical protein BKA70DRAFT_1220389 [Coprinopsis sp. MPI-PUGE-AT-0042]|nr:hypothetical protein BKA70DRAFT_1220389 [Coprinopsis sp. MPI-PUGE-AT-0042]